MKTALLLSLCLVTSLPDASEGQACDLCGEGKILTNPTGIVPIPNQGDFSCSDVFASTGNFDAATCEFVQGLIGECACAEPPPFECDLCGEGNVPTNSTGSVSVPDQGEFTCADIFASTGSFTDASTCDVVKGLIGNCACAPESQPEPEPEPEPEPFSCDLCGEGLGPSNPNGSVSIPNQGDFTCAQIFGSVGQWNEATCDFVRGFIDDCSCAEIDDSGPPPFSCNLCGEGFEPTNPQGTILLLGNDPFTCAQIFGAQATFDEATCNVFVPNVGDCGCKEILQEGETREPTEPPTLAPTYGETPDCYQSITEINQREFALPPEEVAVGRTYILCPDSVFFLADFALDPVSFTNGDEPFLPRPNVLIKCGDTGSSSNKCRLLGGGFAVFTIRGLTPDPAQTNVTFQGLTFDSVQQSAVRGQSPGDLTFTDCIFKNHQSVAPVDLQFASQAGETLSVTFNYCVFENNRILDVGLPTIVRAADAANVLSFDNCVFRGNEYADTSVSNFTYAIATPGPLQVTNSCFEGNFFLGAATIASFGSEDSIVMENNYVELEDQEGLDCPFVAFDAVTETNFTGCILPAAETCQAMVDMAPTFAPQPTEPVAAPTRVPVPRATLPPSPSPTTIEEFSGSNNRHSLIWLGGVLILALSVVS